MSTDLRVVILGTGMIAEVHRRAALLNGAQIIAAMSSSPENTEDAADRWRTAALRSLDELGELAPDVVHVCTPNALHAQQVEAAIRADAHVFCEKPLTVNSRQAQRLATLAASRGRIATVPFVYRFHPLVREIRARVATGGFGPWQLLHGSYLQDWLVSPNATSWRLDAAARGPSRAFADIGSHWCDLVEFVSGERIASLTAATTITVPQRPATSSTTFGAAATPGPLPEMDTEDAATVLFRTTSGVLGSVSVSQVSARRKNLLWFELDGQHKSAVFDQENPETIWLGSEASAEIIQRDPSHGAPEQRRLSRLPAGHPEGYPSCFENFLADTYATVRGEPGKGYPPSTTAYAPHTSSTPYSAPPSPAPGSTYHRTRKRLELARDLLTQRCCFPPHGPVAATSDQVPPSAQWSTDTDPRMRTVGDTGDRGEHRRRATASSNRDTASWTPGQPIASRPPPALPASAGRRPSSRPTTLQSAAAHTHVQQSRTHQVPGGQASTQPRRRVALISHQGLRAGRQHDCSSLILSQSGSYRTSKPAPADQGASQ
jgi:predicted dehydrogenase